MGAIMVRLNGSVVVPIRTGQYGNPPRTARRDFGFVMLLLLWRMRADLLLLAVISAIVFTTSLHAEWIESAKTVAILGITVSIFIGFRNTQAISRWWEARKLWGAMVNCSRNWADTLTSLLSQTYLNDNRGLNLVRIQVAIVWQLNFQLRNFWHQDLYSLQVDLLQSLGFDPSINLRQLEVARAKAVRKLHEERMIDSWGRQQLMVVANATTDAIGGLEKIRNTPLPASYDVFVRLLSWIFGVQLLLVFHAQGDSLLSSIMGIVLFLLFLIAERIGAYVEGPFDEDGSSFSLPLNAICLTIFRDLLGEEPDSCSHLLSRDPVRWT